MDRGEHGGLPMLQGVTESQTQLGNQTKGLPWRLSWWGICPQCRSARFIPWARRILWRREWQPTPVFLPGEFHRQRSLVGYSPRGHKEPDTTEQLTQHIRISDPISEHLFERIKIRISDRCPPWSPQGHSQQPDVETTSVPSADEGDEVHMVDTPQTLKTTTFCRVR